MPYSYSTPAYPDPMMEGDPAVREFELALVRLRLAYGTQALDYAEALVDVFRRIPPTSEVHDFEVEYA